MQDRSEPGHGRRGHSMNRRTLRRCAAWIAMPLLFAGCSSRPQPRTAHIQAHVQMSPGFATREQETADRFTELSGKLESTYTQDRAPGTDLRCRPPRPRHTDRGRTPCRRKRGCRRESHHVALHRRFGRGIVLRAGAAHRRQRRGIRCSPGRRDPRPDLRSLRLRSLPFHDQGRQHDHAGGHHAEIDGGTLTRCGEGRAAIIPLQPR